MSKYLDMDEGYLSRVSGVLGLDSGYLSGVGQVNIPSCSTHTKSFKIFKQAQKHLVAEVKKPEVWTKISVAQI